MRCAHCDKLGDDLIKTACGDWLCEDCWDDYICTDTGRLEYFIGFCRGDYHPDEFDADFVYEAVKSYKLNHNLLNFTAEQLVEFENKAKELGIL
jgi:hypothetical protein